MTTTITPYRRVAQAMGTAVSVHVYGDDPRGMRDAVDELFAEIERLEAMFSTFRSGSEISLVNRGVRTPAECSIEVCEVLDACQWLDHASAGAFRAFRPGDPPTLDPSGFVKGWATERATRHLVERGFTNWCVNAGGDVLASGRPGVERTWRVGISDPRDASSVRATIEVRDGAVATSGTAARGMHLWDGRTGERVAPFASLTVIGPTLTWADAFATAAFALGDGALDWVSQFDGYEAMAIRGDGSIVTTPGCRA